MLDISREIHQDALEGGKPIQLSAKDGMESIRSGGKNLKLAVMFTDIRGFTSLTERNSAHDIFHFLNRYYEVMGEAVINYNGYIHQYFGDGMMALFGFYARDPYQICLDAVSTGLQMLDDLPEFNVYLKEKFGEKIDIGIGIHFGDVLAGRIGHPKHLQLNILGDVVNAASRIQDATKKAKTHLLISDSVYWELGATVLKASPFKTKLKGKKEIQRLYEVSGFYKGFHFGRLDSPRVRVRRVNRG